MEVRRWAGAGDEVFVPNKIGGTGGYADLGDRSFAVDAVVEGIGNVWPATSATASSS